ELGAGDTHAQFCPTPFLGVQAAHFAVDPDQVLVALGQGGGGGGAEVGGIRGHPAILRDPPMGVARLAPSWTPPPSPSPPSSAPCCSRACWSAWSSPAARSATSRATARRCPRPSTPASRWP